MFYASNFRSISFVRFSFLSLLSKLVRKRHYSNVIFTLGILFMFVVFICIILTECFIHISKRSTRTRHGKCESYSCGCCTKMNLPIHIPESMPLWMLSNYNFARNGTSDRAFCAGRSITFWYLIQFNLCTRCNLSLRGS